MTISPIPAPRLTGRRASWAHRSAPIPVMQQRVKLNLKAADGAEVQQEVWHTIHKVPAAKIAAR